MDATTLGCGGRHPACRIAGLQARRNGLTLLPCDQNFARQSGRQDAALYGRQDARRHCAAFTLIELILVLVLLAVVIAISAPSLSRFFRSRGLDSEARRFMALTRHAQSRAVSEGVPMVLWLETRQRTYGLNADKTFIEDDPKAEQFTVDETLQVEVRLASDAMAASQVSQFKNEKQATSGLYTLRFNPDGFVSPSSPETVVFRQGNNGELWVAQSRNRLNYEIQAGKPVLARR